MASIDDILPEDGTTGTLIGRVWRKGKPAGPSVVAIRADGVFDLTATVPTTADLCNAPDPASLAHVARRHAAATTWEQLRLADEPLPLPDGPLSPWIARWMDDGFFARWVLGAYPHIATRAFEVKDLLGPPLGPRLMEALVRLLE